MVVDGQRCASSPTTRTRSASSTAVTGRANCTSDVGADGAYDSCITGVSNQALPLLLFGMNRERIAIMERSLRENGHFTGHGRDGAGLEPVAATAASPEGTHMLLCV